MERGKRRINMPRFQFKLPLKLRRISSAAGNTGSSPTPRARGRRDGFSAVHFKKEKILKQLHGGIDKSDVTQVEEVVESVDIAELEDGTVSFVLRACKVGNLGVLAVLLRNGANVNLIGEGSNVAPLHAAAKCGNTAMAAILLSNGANPNVQTKYEKKTPLHIATLEGYIDIIRLLVANGADVNQGDIYGSCPLHMASRMNRAEILKELIETHLQVDANKNTDNSKGSVDIYDNEGWTALHLAAEAGNENIVKVLLDNNANIDSQSKYGRTPLHWACSSGHVSIVHFLLQKGASANIRDLHDHLPLFYAKNETIKTLVGSFTSKDEPTKKFASSIGLFLNAKPKEIQAKNDNIVAVSPSLGNNKVRKWMSQDTFLSSISNENNEEVYLASAKSTPIIHRSKMAAVTICVPNEPDQSEMDVEAEIVGLGQNNLKPDLLVAFQKMMSKVSGLLTNMEQSIKEIDTVFKISADGAFTFSQQHISEYSTKLQSICCDITRGKENLHTDSGHFVNLVKDHKKTNISQTAHSGYVIIANLLTESIVDFLAEKDNGWKLLLYRLPLPEEISGILSFQLQMQTIDDREKIQQVISQWALNADMEDNVLYMRTLLQAFQKCEFDNADTDHVKTVLGNLVCKETSFRTGRSSNHLTKLIHLVGKLPEKEIRQMHHQIQSTDNSLNVFPTLDELSVSETMSISDSDAGCLATDNLGANKAGTRNNKSSSEKLVDILRTSLDEEDQEKIIAAMKYLILCGREDLLPYLL